MRKRKDLFENADKHLEVSDVMYHFGSSLWKEGKFNLALGLLPAFWVHSFIFCPKLYSNECETKMLLLTPGFKTWLTRILSDHLLFDFRCQAHTLLERRTHTSVLSWPEKMSALCGATACVHSYQGVSAGKSTVLWFGIHIILFSICFSGSTHIVFNTILDRNQLSVPPGNTFQINN